MNSRHLRGVSAALVAAGAGLIVPTARAQSPRPALVALSKDASALNVVDPKTLKIVGSVSTGPVPHEVAVSADGKVALATNYGAHSDGTTISAIDLVGMKETRISLLGLKGPQGEDWGDLRGPHGVEFYEGKFYFTAEGSKKIARFDPATNRVDWELEIGQERTHMLVVAKKTHGIYTANVNSATVTAAEPNREGGDWTKINIPVGKGVEGIDISPDGTEVWAANAADGTVSIIDTSAKKVTRTVDVGTKHSNRLKFTLDGRTVLISDMGNGELVVVDAASRNVKKRVKLGNSAEGILLNPDGRVAYVAVSGENKVAVVDLKKLEPLGWIEGIANPDGMGWAK